MKREFDVIIVGAGINGIACGAYLQKAGLDVAVIEKCHECGPFCMTQELFEAGALVDTHAAIPIISSSPCMKDLELEKFGLKIIHPPIQFGATFPDGTNTLVFHDYKKTAQSIGRHSEKDAKKYMDIMERIMPDSQTLSEMLTYSPPSPEKRDRIWELGKYADIEPNDFRTMNGFEFFDLLFESERVKQTFMAIAAMEVVGKPLLKGEGALAALFSLYFPTGIAKGGMHNIPHSLVRCFRHHGGTLIVNSPVEKISVEGKVAKGAVISELSPYPEKEISARHAVICHVSPPVALEIIGEQTIETVDPELARKMREWDMSGAAGTTSFYLLKKPPTFKSQDWDPQIRECHFPFRAGDSWEHIKQYYIYYENEELWKFAGGIGEIFATSAYDESYRSEQGHLIISFEEEYPVNLRREGGVKRWDDDEFKGRLHEIHTEMLETLAPGFKDLIIDEDFATCLDNWRKNSSAVFGHELGGDVSGDQWIFSRMPHRMPIKNLYMSQSTWPIGLSNLASGYVAACVVAEDLGVRERSWWKSRPLEWYFEKLGVKI